MQVSLTPELEAFVDQKVKSGNFSNPNEVIQKGLRLLMDMDDPCLEELRREIDIGWQQMEKGEVAPLDVQAILAKVRKNGVN